MVAAAQLPPVPPTRRDLSLDDALRIGTATSEAVALARGGVTSAHGLRISARGERLPQLNGSFSYLRTLDSPFRAIEATPTDSLQLPPACSAFTPDPQLPIEERVRLLEAALGCTAFTGEGIDFSRAGFGQENAFSLGLFLAQPLYAGGRIRAQNRLADAGLRNAGLELDAQEAQAVVDVVQKYYDALLSERLLDIAEQSLAHADETLELTTLAFQVGDQAEFDVLRARVARNNQRIAVARQRADRALAFAALKQLLDVPIDQEVRLTTGLDDDPRAVIDRPEWVPDAAADTSSAARVTVRQAAATVEMQEAQVKVTHAQRLPEVRLTSGYALLAYPPSALPSWSDVLRDWAIGLEVNVPVFDRRLRGNVTQVRGELEQARVRLLQMREAAAFDTRTKLETQAAALASLEATTGNVAEAERSFDIALVRYREGMSTLTELGDTRLALAQAQADRAQALRDLMVVQVQLLLIRDLPLEIVPGATTLVTGGSVGTRPTTSPGAATGELGSRQVAPSRGIRGTTQQSGGGQVP